MKHKYFALPVLLLAAILSAAVCSDKPVKETASKLGTVSESSDKYNSMECIDPLSGILKKKNTGDTASRSIKVELHGTVEVNETGDVYIVINPRSKSRETYLVTGAKKRAVAGFRGRQVNVKCCFLEKRRWSGTVRVYEVLN